jgi:hypothetical protein
MKARPRCTESGLRLEKTGRLREGHGRHRVDLKDVHEVFEGQSEGAKGYPECLVPPFNERWPNHPSPGLRKLSLLTPALGGETPLWPRVVCSLRPLHPISTCGIPGLPAASTRAEGDVADDDQ